MRKSIAVKAFAIFLANVLLSVAILGNASANTHAIGTSDITPTTADKTYVINESSSYNVTKNINVAGSYYRELAITVFNETDQKPISNATITVISFIPSRSTDGLYTDIILGVIIGIVIAVGILFIILTAGLATPAVALLIAVAIGGSIGGVSGLIFNYTRSLTESRTDVVTSNAKGVCSLVHSNNDWALNYYVYIDTDKYYDFATPCVINDASTYNDISLYLLPRNNTGTGYAPSPYDVVQKDMGMFEGMVYAPTTDKGEYNTNAYFTPIDVYDDYALYDLNPEAWQAKILNKTSDVTMVQSQRLIYINPSAFTTLIPNVVKSSVHMDASYWIGDKAISISRNNPSGGVSFNFTAGGFWQYGWVWTIGVLDLNQPVTIQAFIEYNTSDGHSHVLSAGTELVNLLSDQPYTIEFKYPNQRLIGDISHDIICEHIYPIIISDIKWSYYPVEQLGVEVSHIETSGFQSIIPILNVKDTNISFYNPHCTYTQQIMVYDIYGDLVSSSADNISTFYSDRLTTARTIVVVEGNITNEIPYTIEVTIGEWGDIAYASSLYYQLTDWQNHNGLAENFSDFIDRVFAPDHNISGIDIQQLRIYITDMKIKIDNLQIDLNSFIAINGGSKYTGYCQNDIDNFNTIYTHINELLNGSTSNDFNIDVGKRAELLTACKMLLSAYNLAFLDYSAAVAYTKGFDAVSDDIGVRTGNERNIVIKYVEDLNPPWYAGIVKMLPSLIIILISVGIGGVAGWLVARSGSRNWHKSGSERSRAALAIGVFILTAAISYVVIGQFFSSAIYSLVVG